MYEIFLGENGEFYWRLKARNGEVIAISEGYTTKENAINGIRSVKANADSPINDLALDKELLK